MKQLFEKRNPSCHSEPTSPALSTGSGRRVSPVTGNQVTSSWRDSSFASSGPLTLLRVTWGIIVLLLISTTNLYLVDVRAEEAEQKVQALETCFGEHPKFKPPDDETTPYEPFKIDGELNLDSPKTFRIAFEEARNKYHAFVDCVFDEASKEILESEDIDDLNSPSDACLDPETLAKIANSTGSQPLMLPLLKAYNAYTAHLKLLYENFRVKGAGGKGIEEADRAKKKMQTLVTNETQDAITALHTAFAKLMELRQVFVMHVHFQCMLHNLEDYRRFLGELRSVIELLPPRIIDASMSK